MRLNGRGGSKTGTIGIGEDEVVLEIFTAPFVAEERVTVRKVVESISSVLSVVCIVPGLQAEVVKF